MDRKEKYILLRNFNKVFNTVIKPKFDCVEKVELNDTIFVQQFNNDSLKKTLKIVLTVKSNDECIKKKKELLENVNLYVESIKSNVLKMVRLPFHKINFKVDINFL
jgi:hypothetical protein